MTVVLYRTNLPARTWVTIFLALAGILVVFWGRLGAGDIVGDAAALMSAIFMASTLVLINYNPTINSLASIGLGSFFAAIIAFVMGAHPLDVSTGDLVYLVINGGIIIPISLGLITYGPKLISAPEVSLIMLLETVLGPIWVWFVLHEQPPQEALIGGCLIITAVLVNAGFSFWSKPQSKIEGHG
jgi:drug/metabolite transporter (DMT)-like permease